LIISFHFRFFNSWPLLPKFHQNLPEFYETTQSIYYGKIYRNSDKKVYKKLENLHKRSKGNFSQDSREICPRNISKNRNVRSLSVREPIRIFLFHSFFEITLILVLKKFVKQNGICEQIGFRVIFNFIFQFCPCVLVPLSPCLLRLAAAPDRERRRALPCQFPMTNDGRNVRRAPHPVP